MPVLGPGFGALRTSWSSQVAPGRWGRGAGRARRDQPAGAGPRGPRRCDHELTRRHVRAPLPTAGSPRRANWSGWVTLGIGALGARPSRPVRSTRTTTSRSRTRQRHVHPQPDRRAQLRERPFELSSVPTGAFAGAPLLCWISRASLRAVTASPARTASAIAVARL